MAVPRGIHLVRRSGANYTLPAARPSPGDTGLRTVCVPFAVRHTRPTLLNRSLKQTGLILTGAKIARSHSAIFVVHIFSFRFEGLFPDRRSGNFPFFALARRFPACVFDLASKNCI